MTYREAYEKAERKLERGEITIGEFDELTKPLDEEIRPHGEWIRHVDDLFPEESTEECSVCHEEQRITGNDDNFCPNCGADMREEGESN